MSETGWAAFIADNHEQETPAEQASRLARQQAERQDRAELAAEAERAAALEDERDRRLLSYQVAGIAGRSAAQVFAAGAGIMDEDAEYEAAQKVIERIDRRRALRAAAMRFDAERVAAADTAQRSAAGDLLAPAKQALEQHREYVAASRAARNRATAPERAPRPKGGRGSVAIRSEHCIHCINQGASDEESYLLHSDPDLNVPVTAPDRQPEQAERRGQYQPVRVAGRDYAYDKRHDEIVRSA